MKSLIFSEEYINKLKTANDPLFSEIKAYIEDITDKDYKDIFHPFCIACGIESKYHKFAWTLLACEMKLLSLSLLWIIEPKPIYLQKVINILSYLINLPNWSDTYNRLNKTKNTYPETAAVMRGFALATDAFGESLGPNLLTQVRKRLAFACERLYEIIENREEKFILDQSDDWALDLATALGIGGKLLRDFDSRSEGWRVASVALVKGFIDNLPSDGSHRNGLLRWEYSLFNIYTFIHVVSGEDRDELLNSENLKKIRYFAINQSAALCSNVSRFDQGIHISIYNPLNGFISKLLAEIYKDPYLAWGIKTAPKKNYYHPLEIFFTNNKSQITNHKSQITNSIPPSFATQNPPPNSIELGGQISIPPSVSNETATPQAIDPKGSQKIELAEIFRDLGLGGQKDGGEPYVVGKMAPAIGSVYYPEAGKVYLRSGFLKDDNLITFKSSKHPNRLSHKDQNNMEIFLGEKEMLIESGTCYSGHPNYEKRYFGSHAHNVLLIDGKPQMPFAKGEVKEFITNENYDFVKGDAASVYSKARAYTRNLLFIKPNILIVYDYVLLNSTGSFEWLWHTPGSIHVHSLTKPNSVLFTNEDKNMSMFILEPESWSYRVTKDYTLENWWNMHEITHDVLRIKISYRKEVDMVCLFHLNSADHETLPCEYENKTINLDYHNNHYDISFDKGKLSVVEN